MKQEVIDKIKKLNLKKPIVFFDLETTGLNIDSDKIVSISATKLMPDGTILSKSNASSEANLVKGTPRRFLFDRKTEESFFQEPRGM